MLMNYLIIKTTKFQQELRNGRMKVQVEFIIQYYYVNLLFHKSLNLKECFILLKELNNSMGEMINI